MPFERKQGKKVSKVAAVRWRFYYLLLFAFACEEAVEVKWICLDLLLASIKFVTSHYVLWYINSKTNPMHKKRAKQVDLVI